MTAQALPENLARWIEEGNIQALDESLSALHPADAAWELSQLPAVEIARYIELVGPASALPVFEFAPFEMQKETLGHLSRAALATLINQMAPDDRADLVEELDERFQERLLSLLIQSERQNVRKLLTHEPDTAGAHMTTNYALLNPGTRIRVALEQMRLQATTKETIYYIYVVDQARKLIGFVSLRDLITASPDSQVGDIMHSQVISVRVDEDIEEVAKLSSHYDFLAVPVVDQEGRMVGIITFDDLYDVITEEATEDIYHLANLDTDEKIGSPLLRSVKLRVPWLLLNLGTGLLAALVVAFFADTIDQVVALASLMTLVALLGGNAGNQSLTVVVRAMALGQIEVKHNWGVLGKEALVGLMNGFIVGLVVGVIAFLWYGNPWMGLIMWLAFMANMVIAGLCGAVVPIVLRRLGLDPALGSSIFVTTATDVGGFSIFLGLSTLFLDYLLNT